LDKNAIEIPIGAVAVIVTLHRYGEQFADIGLLDGDKVPIIALHSAVEAGVDDFADGPEMSLHGEGDVGVGSAHVDVAGVNE
jgi:hypothetical protein